MHNRINKKIDKYLNDENLSVEEKKQLKEVKKELQIAKTEIRIFYLLNILIKIITGFLED